MDRRSVLKQIGGASAIAALAGCISTQKQDATDTAPDDGGSDQTEASTETTGPAGTAKAWYSLPETEKPTREETLKAFNENSRHTIEGADISDMKKKTTSAIPAGQGPGTFEWAHDLVGDYYQRGFVVDQSDELSVSLDKFTSAAREAIQFDGNVVGLPHDAETVALIYNKDVVDEPPETVSDMVSVMKEHHDPSNGKYGLSYPWDPYFTSAWLQAFGGYYFDASKDDVLGVDDAETVKGLEWALENLKPYMPEDPNYGPQAAAFAEGNAAYAINGPWYLATLNDKGVDYGVSKLPTPDGGEPNPYTGITMWYFADGMTADAGTAAATRAFVEWYATNEDHILQVAKDQGAIPVLDSLVGSDELPDNVKAFSQAVDQGVPMPTHPKMGNVWGPVGDALANAFNGDASAEKALDNAAKTIRSNWE